MKSFYLTDAGKVRDHNEDSVIIVKKIGGAHVFSFCSANPNRPRKVWV